MNYVMHYSLEKNGETYCSIRAPTENCTNDWNKVTCKRCLKNRPKLQQPVKDNNENRCGSSDGKDRTNNIGYGDGYAGNNCGAGFGDGDCGTGLGNGYSSGMPDINAERIKGKRNEKNRTMDT